MSAIKNHQDQIIDRFKAGENDAVKQVFYDYYPMLCKAVYRIVQDQSVAEDLAQNVFIKSWRKRESINITKSLSAYLRRMAINEALYYLRQQNRRQQLREQHIPSPNLEPTPLDYLIREEVAERIDDAIDDLPPRCQTIFRLNREEGLSYREIAQKLHIKTKTVENQIAKALRILRVQIKAA
ncbi:MAG: RNA polymerase sigma-70 factor [Bacteroidota bacterium]